MCDEDVVSVEWCDHVTELCNISGMRWVMPDVWGYSHPPFV